MLAFNIHVVILTAQKNGPPYFQEEPPLSQNNPTARSEPDRDVPRHAEARIEVIGRRSAGTDRAAINTLGCLGIGHEAVCARSYKVAAQITEIQLELRCLKPAVGVEAITQ